MRKFERWVVRENRIYIMPTGQGGLYLSGIIVLILTASTYNNNLIFILAFFLFAIFFVSMMQTHYNLKGVRLHFTGSEEAFEGDNLGVNFQIEQKRARAKFSLSIRARSKQFLTLHSPKYDLKPDEKTKPARIEIRAWKRGIHALPSVVIESQFPLGLFRAWKVFRPQAQLVIYPAPDLNAVLTPKAADHGELDQGLRKSPEGDFGELKSYEVGESYHQIAWKHFARTRLLYTKVHWGADDRHYVIPWQASRQSFEADLRRMSGWIKRAADENASFEMQTPDAVIATGRGLEHARACWRALARAKADA